MRPGGRLVYATCSLLAAENDAIVNAFLAEHGDYTVTPAVSALGARGIVVPHGDSPEGFLRLLPHTHHTDGFFAARLQRSESG